MSVFAGIPPDSGRTRTPVGAAGRSPGHRAHGAVILVGLGSSAAALAAAPMLMPPSYSWMSRTTSESAAQGIAGAWLARLGFVLFGLSVMALAFSGTRRWGRWSALSHYAFGVFMVATAAFSTRPWTGGWYDPTEDVLHSVAATAMGFAFAAGVLLAAAHRGRPARVDALVVDAVAVAASVVVPLAMSALPAVDGLLQRTMFAIAYGWYALAAVGVLRAGDPAGAPRGCRAGTRSARSGR